MHAGYQRQPIGRSVGLPTACNTSEADRRLAHECAIATSTRPVGMMGTAIDPALSIGARLFVVGLTPRKTSALF